ncbi:MAG: glycerol kinase GlpK, partial [Eubacteriales bacterium]|nr:glycerol kinase GlpK [Eubacteriales bacterium]
MKYLLAFDQGSTSSRCILFRKSEPVATYSMPHEQIYPMNGWVEHNPVEIYNNQIKCATEVMSLAKVKTNDISAIGITNQRETVVVWEKLSGKPIYNAIVWQCRRTADYCDKLKAEGFESVIRDKTGLPIDSYFSATKLKWVLDTIPGARERAKNGELLFGTIDTWLIWNLTKGKTFATDYTNASRTMMYNIHTLEWDRELLELFDIPEIMLPKVCPSCHIYGETSFLGSPIPIAGVAGDQQSAMFGQLCFNMGDTKNTYGTGAFLLMNTGRVACRSKNGLITTIACGTNGDVNYALEGSVFTSGSLVQWLRDDLKMIPTAAASERVAEKVPDSGGIYLVPAFVGLGAPYWDPYVRGTIVGITRSIKREHIVRAALEAIALQSNDVIKQMQSESNIKISTLRVDGGASANNLLMQMQADISNVRVDRPACIETTAMGASYLAGLTIGYYKSPAELSDKFEPERTFRPAVTPEWREKLI